MNKQMDAWLNILIFFFLSWSTFVLYEIVCSCQYVRATPWTVMDAEERVQTSASWAPPCSEPVPRDSLHILKFHGTLFSFSQWRNRSPKESGLSKLEQAPWSPDPQTIFHVLHLDCINSQCCVPSKQWVTEDLGGREGMWGGGRGGLVDSQAVCAGKSHERHPQRRMQHQNKMYCI